MAALLKLPTLADRKASRCASETAAVLEPALAAGLDIVDVAPDSEVLEAGAVAVPIALVVMVGDTVGSPPEF